MTPMTPIRRLLRLAILLSLTMGGTGYAQTPTVEPVVFVGAGDIASCYDENDEATARLLLFIKNRWFGLWPILYGDQVRQTALDEWIFNGTLDVEHLPEPDAAVVAAQGSLPEKGEQR